jgi:hypothetical protein
MRRARVKTYFCPIQAEKARWQSQTIFLNATAGKSGEAANKQ